MPKGGRWLNHPHARVEGDVIQILIRGVWGMGRLLREKEVDETPQRAQANEEARQLARGKRVIPQTPLALNKRNGPTLLTSSIQQS